MLNTKSLQFFNVSSLQHVMFRFEIVDSEVKFSTKPSNENCVHSNKFGEKPLGRKHKH